MANICHQVFALSLKEEGAITFFEDNLPVDVVRAAGKGYADFYEALKTFHSKTGLDPVDPKAFKHWLAKTDICEALGGEEELDKYFEEISEAELAPPAAVAAALRVDYKQKKQVNLIEELAGLLNSNNSKSDVRAKIDDITQEIADLNRSESDPLEKIHDGNRIAITASELWELPDFLPTPFPALNKSLGYTEDAGFCRGAVHAVLAKSGLGKSTFVKTLMNNWVENGNKVLFVNYEEAKAHWERILFTQITKQNVYLAEEVAQAEREFLTNKFTETMNRWGENFMVKHDPDTPYYEDLEVWIREIHRKKRTPDVIIIDTINSLFLKQGSGLPRWGQYEQMMVRLEKLAKDLNCVIVITSQENSNREKESRAVVQQSDIGGSLAIAQKSSVTIFITKAKAQFGDDSMEDTLMQLQIPKNRITGVTGMMNPPIVKYSDDCKLYQDIDMMDILDYVKGAIDADDFEKIY